MEGAAETSLLSFAEVGTLNKVVTGRKLMRKAQGESEMLKSFALDGVEYAADDLEASGRAILEKLTVVQTHITMLENMQALLTKAKNAYIADLKAEIIKNKSGVDLAALFDAE